MRRTDHQTHLACSAQDLRIHLAQIAVQQRAGMGVAQGTSEFPAESPPIYHEPNLIVKGCVSQVGTTKRQGGEFGDVQSQTDLELQNLRNSHQRTRGGVLLAWFMRTRSAPRRIADVLN
jgi:hypothetical protein